MKLIMMLYVYCYDMMKMFMLLNIIVELYA